MSNTADIVRKIISDHLGVELEKIIDEAYFLDDLGADSLDTVELTMAMEEEFGIEISDDAASTVNTVGELIALVERLKGD